MDRNQTYSICRNVLYWPVSTLQTSNEFEVISVTLYCIHVLFKGSFLQAHSHTERHSKQQHIIIEIKSFYSQMIPNINILDPGSTTASIRIKTLLKVSGNITSYLFYIA